MRTKQEKIFSSKTLSYFLLLSDTLNYTQTAKILGITQPALTQQVQKLESAVGAKMFYSGGGRTLRLTDAGYTMLSATHEVTQILSKATDEIQRSVNAPIGELSIGILSSIESEVFEAFLAESFAKMPGVKITFHMLSRIDIWKCLENNQIDFAIMYLPDISIKSWKLYDSHSIIKEDLMFIHHDKKLSNSTKGVKLEKSLEYDWITYPPEFYLASVIEESYNNAMLDQPNSVAHFSTPDQILRFVNASKTVTALPESFILANNLPKGTYASKFDPTIKFDLGFVFRKDKDSIPRVNDFFNDFSAYLDERSYIDRLKDIKKNKFNQKD